MRVSGRGDTLKDILNRLGWCLVMIFLGLWLFSTRTCAQDALPDAPKPQAETCDFRLQSCIRDGELISTTWNGSTPATCYTRSGDSLIPDPCSIEPKHRRVEPLAAKAGPLRVEPAKNAPRFLTFRKSWQDPPLRTNRQMFRSKLYVASQIGGAVAMIVACRNKRSGEGWASEVPAVLGVDAMAYLGGRFFTQPLAVGPGIYEMVHYSQAATK